MAMTKAEISGSLVQLHEWFGAHSEIDPKSTVRDSIAIAQRVLLTNDINVADRDALLEIVIDELFSFDRPKELQIRQAAKDAWVA